MATGTELFDVNGESIGYLTGKSRTSGKRLADVFIAGGGAIFTPSSYDADITIVAGVASVGVIATGAEKIQFVNQGTGDVRIAFGTDAIRTSQIGRAHV